MKTTVFHLVDMRSEQLENELQQFDLIYKVPSLPAYSVLHHDIELDAVLPGADIQKVRGLIEGDVVRLKGVSNLALMTKPDAVMTVSYAGICSYDQLFPHVENLLLRQRLGQFSEEAEKAFDASAWMSFVLMAGAVIEGLLVSRFGNNKNFKKLILLANEAGVFDGRDLDSLDEVREARNRVHAERFGEPFVDRKLAMDTYVIYNKLLKRRWDLD